MSADCLTLKGRRSPNTVNVKQRHYYIVHTSLKKETQRDTHNTDICTWFTPELVRMSHDVVVYE